jgi:hypothetical protein
MLWLVLGVLLVLRSRILDVVELLREHETRLLLPVLIHSLLVRQTALHRFTVRRRQVLLQITQTCWWVLSKDGLE